MKGNTKAGGGPEVLDDLVLGLGLCSTCNHLQACTTMRGSVSMRVMHCEEFDDFQPPPPRPQAVAPNHNPGNPTPLDNPTRNSSRGLCVTCSHIATCTFTRPEGGVWHCEEYE